MQYIGSPGSVTYLHIELNGLPSINVILAGEPKIWLIVEPQDLKFLSQAMERKMEEEGALFHSGKNNKYCNRRAVHKPGFLFDLTELETLGIRYSLIYQEVGDLVFVGCDVPHEVINLGYNQADAKLIQHPNLLTFERLLRCQCKEALPPLSSRYENPPGHFVRRRVTVDMGCQTETTSFDQLQETIDLDSYDDLSLVNSSGNQGSLNSQPAAVVPGINFVQVMNQKIYGKKIDSLTPSVDVSRNYKTFSL